MTRRHNRRVSEKKGGVFVVGQGTSECVVYSLLDWVDELAASRQSSTKNKHQAPTTKTALTMIWLLYFFYFPFSFSSFFLVPFLPFPISFLSAALFAPIPHPLVHSIFFFCFPCISQIAKSCLFYPRPLFSPSSSQAHSLAFWLPRLALFVVSRNNLFLPPPSEQIPIFSFVSKSCADLFHSSQVCQTKLTKNQKGNKKQKQDRQGFFFLLHSSLAHVYGNRAKVKCAEAQSRTNTARSWVTGRLEDWMRWCFSFLFWIRTQHLNVQCECTLDLWANDPFFFVQVPCSVPPPLPVSTPAYWPIVFDSRPCASTDLLSAFEYLVYVGAISNHNRLPLVPLPACLSMNMNMNM